MRDFTKHKMEEEALSVSAEKYRSLLENIETSYYEMDLRGNFTLVNDIMCRDLGYSREELLGMHYKVYSKPENMERATSMFREIYQTGKPKTLLNYEVTRKDGSMMIVEQSASLMRGSSGEAIGFQGVGRDVTVRHRAEQELKESEKKYRTVLETMEEGLYDNDLDGNYMFVSNVACRRLGYERDELIGKNYRMNHTPEMAQRLFEVCKQIYRTGKPALLMDFEAVRKDGITIKYQANIALIRDHLGKPIGFRTLSRDISERMKTEEALRKSEEKYRTILETMEEGLFESDPNGDYTFVNDAACNLMGYERDEMIGKNYRMSHPPETIRYLKDAYGRMYETGKSEILMDYEAIRKDGSVRIHQANIAFIRDHAGDVVGSRALVRDVTERKKMEDDLRRSEEKYRTVLEAMAEGLFETDLEGNYTFVNDAACRLLGRERDELIGKNFGMNHTPETARRISEMYYRIYTTGETGFLHDYEAIRKDGSVRIHQANIALIRDQAGTIIGTRALVRDVTELKKAEEEKARIEEQLFQAQKMESVGRLAGGVAHDFNNMLTVILGYAELISARLPQGDPLLTDMLEIEKAAGRSRDLTQQLLAFSRKEIIAPRPVELNGMIVSAQKTLLRLIGEDIDLRFYPGENLWKIKVDPSQMEHLLINFAVNARDAMPEGGKLTVETENIHINEAYCRTHPEFIPGHYVLLGVSDDGVGMDRETMSHLFEPFFTTKEKGRGTGLGLATVYGIVKQNEGFINVYSEPGKGTTFKIYIPRSTEEAVEKEEAEEALPASGTGSVLLVEDDDMVRTMTTEMLQAIGYTVLSTGNPLEALSFFKKDDMRIDLVITDVVMPGMSGKELSGRIEAVRSGVRVLFMSGYTTNVIAHRGVLEEGVYFIQKPFSMSDLARKIRDAVDGR